MRCMRLKPPPICSGMLSFDGLCRVMDKWAGMFVWLVGVRCFPFVAVRVPSSMKWVLYLLSVAENLISHNGHSSSNCFQTWFPVNTLLGSAEPMYYRAHCMYL